MTQAGLAAPAHKASAGDVLPWAAGSALLGALSVESPLLAAGVGIATALAFLPWMLLFAGLAIASTVQGFSVQVAGYTVRPDMLFVPVFAFRAFTLREIDERRTRDGGRGHPVDLGAQLRPVRGGPGL